MAERERVDLNSRLQKKTSTVDECTEKVHEGLNVNYTCVQVFAAKDDIHTLKDGCYKDGAQSKSYSLLIKSNLHQDQMDFQETEYFKDKAKHWYKIEAKNSELKNVHGYTRATSCGLQHANTMSHVNLKRILNLTSKSI